jgi:hypothetical protein
MWLLIVPFYWPIICRTKTSPILIAVMSRYDTRCFGHQHDGHGRFRAV